MKFFSRILFLFIFIQNLVVNNCIDFYGNFYTVTPLKYNYDQASTFCLSQTNNGLKGYLATIGSEDEFQFLISNGLISSAGIKQVWLGMNDLANKGLWLYNNGRMGTNRPFYDVYFDKCETFCPWSATEPNFVTNERALCTDYDVNLLFYYYMNVDAGTTKLNAICKFSPNTSYVGPVSTAGEVTVSNALGFNFANIVTKFNNIDNSSASFYCSSTKNISASSYTCKIPYPGTGRYYITIQDGSGKLDTYGVWLYPSPFLSMINIPSTLAIGDVVTIVGSNFGTDPSKIIVTFSIQKALCSNVNFLSEPPGYTYQMFTCTFSVSPPTTTSIFPVTVIVNSVKTISYRTPFAFNITSKNYYYSSFPQLGNSSDIADAYVSKLKVDGQNGRMAVVPSRVMYNYLDRVVPGYTRNFAEWTALLPIYFNGSGFYYNSGPFINTVATSYSYNLNFDPTLTSVFGFNFSTASMVVVNPSVQLGVLVEYGGVPVSFIQNKTITIPTSGGIANLALNNFGTIFSIITVKYRNKSINFTKDYIESDINAVIPTGYGGPDPITVTVDTLTTPLNTQFISFEPPSITFADRSPTLGSVITITGNNFYTEPGLIYIAINDTQLFNVQIITNHTKISCEMPPGSGSGNLRMRLSAGELSSPYPYSYMNPSITSTTSLSPLGGKITIYGSNFGLSIPQVSSSQTSNNLVCTTVGRDTPLFCTLVPNQGNTSLQLTVSGLVSNLYTFSYDSPVVTTVSQFEDYLIFVGDNFGNSFYNLQVLIGTISLSSACTGNTTYVVCNPIPWNAESNNIVITGAAFNPAPIPFYFTPTISQLTKTLINTTGEPVIIAGRYFEKMSFGQPEDLVVIDNGFVNNNTGFISNSQLNYQILPGTGTNRLIQVRSGTNRLSNAVTFSFNKPSIVSVTPGPSNSIIIDGYNFGNDISKVTVTISSFKGKSLAFITPHYQLSLTPQPQSINGDLIINVNNQLDTYSPIKLKPSIQTAQTPSIIGGQIEIAGYYLFSTDQDGQNTNIQFYFNNVLTTCQMKAFNTTIYTYTCQIQPGTGQINAFIVNDEIESDPFHLTYQPPQVIDVSSVVYQVGGQVTIKGSNFASTGLQVTIGTTPCTSPSVINITTLVCNFDGLELPESSPLAVSVTVDGLLGTNNIFTYFGLKIHQINQMNETLFIQGENIGPVQNLIITLSGINIKSVCQGNETLLTCGPLPLNIISGQLIIDDGSTIPIPNYNVTLNPWISFISQTLFETEGELITITGRFFEEITNGENNTIEIIDRGLVNSKFNYTDNTTLTYLIEPGTGGNYSLQVSISNRLSNEIIYSYKPPTFISSVQTIDYLTIIGDNFGQVQNNVHVLYQGYQNPLPLNSITNNRLVLRLPSNITNGQFRIQVSNQITDYKKLLLQPVIYKVAPFPLTTGGKVTITGGYMSKNDSDNNMVDIKFNSTNTILNCNYLSTMSPYYIECDQPVGYGSITYYSYYFDQDSNSKVESEPYVHQYQVPIIQSASSIFYKEMKYVTITGQSFTPTNLTIEIGGSPCTKPQYLNENSIECFFDGSVIPPPLGKSLSVSVNASGLQGSNNVFMYYYQKSCPGSCSGQGICNPINGLCKCNQGYSSFDCSVVVNDETPTTPPPTHDSNAISTIPTGYPTNSFEVLVSHLREVKPTGSSEKIYGISNFTWVERTSISQTSTYYRATYKLIVLEITISYFPSYTTSQFANDPMEIQANSLKYLVKVSNWTFASPSNYLQVVFDNKAIKSEVYGCDNNIVPTTSRYGGGQQTTWYQIKTASSDFNSLFSDRIYVDKSIISNQLIILDDNDQLYSDVTPSSLYHLLAAVQVPSFTTSTTIDPNFSSASKSTSSSCDDSNLQNEEKKKTWKLAVGLSVGLFGLLAIVILTIVIIKKKFSNSSTKLKSLNNNNNIDRH